MVKIFQTSWIRIFLSISLFLLSTIGFSQNFFGKPLQHIHDEKCASSHLEKMQEEALGIYGSRDYFESWISGKIEEISKKPSIQGRLQNQRRVIPVVVHVIHALLGLAMSTRSAMVGLWASMPPSAMYVCPLM